MIDSLHFRAVLDTNIIIAALKSNNPRSPNRELLGRWEADEFTLLLSDELRSEYIEKLLTKRVNPNERDWFITALDLYAKTVSLDNVESIVSDDPDDDIVIGTALAGGATHLVTYDPHLRDLGSPFRGIEILDGLHFLYAVRGDVPPDA